MVDKRESLNTQPQKIPSRWIRYDLATHGPSDHISVRANQTFPLYKDPHR